MNTRPTIRLIGPSDISILNIVAPDVFDGEINPLWTNEFLADPRHHMCVALLEEQVIGMISAVHYLHPDKAPELWINEVSVTPAHQNQGIGRSLVSYMLEHGCALGRTEAWLGTEGSNVAACRLYAAAERPAYIRDALAGR